MSLKDFFSDKKAVARENESEDYAVKSNKKRDIIIRVISIFAALIIWVIVINTDTVTISLKDIPVQTPGVTEGMFGEYTFSLDITSVDVDIKGKKQAVDEMNASSVTAEVYIKGIAPEDITDGYEKEFDIVFKSPGNTTVVSESHDSVTVTFRLNDTVRSDSDGGNS